MEQDNSLRDAMQQLINIQYQQMQVLNSISQKQSANINLGSTSMYSMPNTTFAPPAATQNPSVQQFNQFTNTLGSNGTNYGFFDIATGPGSSTSRQTQTLATMDYGSRVGQAVTAGAGVAASGIFDFVASPFLGTATSIGASLGVGAVAGLYSDAAIKEIKKQSAYEKYLYKNSYRFIDSTESTNERGVAGFSVGQSKDAASFLRNFSDQNYMKDQEMMQVVQKFTEGGLLKDVGDLKSFKEKMATLTKNVKAGAIMLNETYDSIADLLSSLKKLGIDQKNFNNLLGMGTVLGGLSGENASDVVRNLANFASNTNSGTGYSNQNLINRTTDTQIYLSSMFNNLETSTSKTPVEQFNYNLIKNLGGASQASQYLQSTMDQMATNKNFSDSALYFFDYNKTTKSFDFNNENYKNFVNGNLTKSQVTDIAASKLQGYADQGLNTAILNWQDQAPAYIKNSLTGGQMSKFVDSVINSYSNDPSIKEANMSQKDILSLLGVKDSNAQNLLTSFLDYRKTMGDGYSSKIQLQGYWNAQNANVQTEMPTLGELISSKWSGFKKWATQPLVNMSDSITENILKWTDSYYNYQDKIPLKYDSYNLRSNLKSASVTDVVNEINKNNDLIASGYSSLSELQKKGYTINSGLMDSVAKKFGSADKEVLYSRDIISDWNQVSSDLRGKKDEITSLAKNTDLSETIVAALMKYDTRNAGTKITKDDINTLVQKMGQENFQYGGNSELALASALTDRSTVDNALGKLGYNVSGLRSVGAQDTLMNVKIDDLNIGDDIKKAVKDALSENIVASSDSSGWTKYGATKTNKDLIEKASSEYGVDKNTLAAMFVTENESGNAKLISKDKYGRPVAYGIGQVTLGAANDFGKGVKSLTTGKTFTGSANELIDDVGLNAAISTKEFKTALDKSGGNALVAYGMYNAGIAGMSDILKASGYSESQWGGLSYDKVMGAIASTKGTDFETYKAIKRFNEKLDEFKVSTTSNNGSVDVTTQQVIKDAEGNTIEKSAAERLQEQVKKGIDNGSTNSIVQTQIDFLKSSKSASLVSQKGIDELYGKLQTSMDTNMGEYGIATYADTKKYIDMLKSAVESGKYDSVESAVNSNQKILSARNSALKKIKRGSTADGASEVTTNLEELEKMVVAYQNKSGMDSDFDTLRRFGEAYGVNIADYNGDATAYNNRLLDLTDSFYSANKKGIQDFINGKDTEDAKRWKNTDLVQKATTFESLKQIEKARGISNGITTLVDGDTSKILTGEEIEQSKYLTTDSKGNIYYDASRNTGDTASLDTIVAWATNGGKKKTTSALLEQAKKLNISGLSSDSGFDEITNILKQQQMKVVEENNKNVQKSRQVIYELTQGDSKSYGDIGLTSSQQKELGESLQKGDLSMLKSMSQDNEALKQMLELFESINDINPQKLQDVINGFENLQKISSDVGLMTKYTGNVVGSDYKDKLDSEMKEIMSSVFDYKDELDKKVEEGLKKGSLTGESFVNALLNGGQLTNTKGEVIAKLSADDIEALTTATSEAMSSALKESFKDNKTVDNVLGNTELVNMMGKDAQDILEKVKEKNTEIVNSSGEERAKLIAERDALVSNVIPAFQDAVKEVGENMKTGADKLATSGQNLADTFVEYDKSLNNAVKTMKDRISTGWGVGGTTNLTEGGNEAKNWFTNMENKLLNSATSWFSTRE